jgi:hypothetical protein
MELPGPPAAVAALAAFVRDRLSGVSDAVAPLLARRDGTDAPVTAGREAPAVLSAARQVALVIVGAAAPFASTSYSRARLIRQMHASGLLTDEHLARTERILQLESVESSDDRSGAPR